MNDVQLGKLKSEYWHLVCHRSQLRAPGDFVKLDWFGEEIVAFNDDGDILLFDNICPHRGARIFTETHGHRRLRCAYHGWSYHRGQFFAPFPSEFAIQDLERARFKTFKQEWCGDLLFAGISPSQPLSSQLGGLWETLIKISSSIASHYSTHTFVWESDWQIAIENAIEQYHTAVGLVHPNTFGKHKMNAGFDEFYEKNSIFRCEFMNERTVKQLRGLARFFDLEYQYPGYQSIHLFPFSMIGSTFGYSYAIQHFFPSAIAERTSFSTRMLASKMKVGTDVGILESFFASASEINRMIFEEDHKICKQVALSSLSEDFNPIYSLGEAKIARFRNSLKNSP